MRKTIIIVFIISILANIILGVLLERKSKGYKSTPIVDTVLIKQKDSIRKVIDTITIAIDKNKKQYYEKISIINSNPVDSDLLFFHEYLEWNRERFDSLQ